MIKRAFSLLLCSVLLSFTLLSGFVTPAAAGSKGSKPRPVITLTKLGDVKLGDPFTLGGTIKNQLGKPLANKSVQFLLGGQYLGQARSDENGLFQRKFTKVLNAGTYTIQVVSAATHLLDLSVASLTFNILPAEIQIQTVPALEGVPFRINGENFVSNEDGLATAKINNAGTYRLDVLADQYHSPAKKIEFARWLEESYQPTREIEVPTTKVIQAGFNVYHLVGQSFVDLDGVPVDPARITEFTIRSAQGDMFVLNDGKPRWIPASRVARRVTGLEETKLLYSVLSVTVDGSNVVNQSQQRFYTYPVENWPISLLLYSMRISARDGLFGSPVGKSVNVQFPDGRVLNYPLNQAGMVEIHSLARGNYSAELVGTSGLSSRTPVALSRNQDISTKVVTYLDLATAGMLGVLVALGLLLYGRPSLLQIFSEEEQAANQEEDWALVPTPEAPPENAGQLYDYRHMRYETVKTFDDEDFEKSTGVDRDIFDKIVALYTANLRKGGKQSKLSGADQILLTLLYLREHRSEFEISQIYGVSETTVRRTIKRVKKVLAESIEFDLTNDIEAQPHRAFIGMGLIEASEQPVEVSNDR